MPPATPVPEADPLSLAGEPQEMSAGSHLFLYIPGVPMEDPQAGLPSVCCVRGGTQQGEQSCRSCQCEVVLRQCTQFSPELAPGGAWAMYCIQ